MDDKIQIDIKTIIIKPYPNESMQTWPQAKNSVRQLHVPATIFIEIVIIIIEFESLENRLKKKWVI